MAECTFYVEPVAVGDCVLKLINSCKAACPGHTAHVFRINGNLGAIDLIKSSVPIPDLPNEAGFAAKLDSVVKRPFLDISGCILNLESPYPLAIQYNEEFEKGRARLKLESNHFQHQHQFGAIIDALAKQFTFLKQVETIKRLGVESEDRLTALSHGVIAEFAAHASKLAMQTSQSVQEINAVILQKTKELDEIYQKKFAELDERYQAKDKDLTERENKFKEDVKQFDLRDNTAVRRGIFQDLKTAINKQKEIVITPATLIKRIAIHSVCIALLAASGTSFGFYSHKILTAEKFDWRLFIPLGTSTLVFASTAIFYLRWMDKWFRDFARAEFANRKFEADMLRASWVVEMFFEWTNKKEVPIPPELIANCSRGLFLQESDGRSSHPFDDLQGLAKDFKKIRFGKGGIELERGNGKPTNDEKP